MKRAEFFGGLQMEVDEGRVAASRRVAD